MRAYGVKRELSWKYMDQGDCLERGAKSQYMKMTSKYRQETRQIHKGRERLRVRQEIRDESKH